MVEKPPANMEANTEWIKAKDQPKPLVVPVQGVLSIQELGAELSSEDD